jgi:sugar diacid utilization regulator
MHLSNTAKVLGIHRNTLSKRALAYKKAERSAARAKAASR